MLTPLDIENKTFSKQIMSGYSIEEVQSFMSELLKDYEKLYRAEIMVSNLEKLYLEE